MIIPTNDIAIIKPNVIGIIIYILFYFYFYFI
uniref:Uncharacterized protein n=1 Tax=viral metagenome TaxID=1070528 RepID=A0A6C0BU26_9ZZZZ